MLANLANDRIEVYAELRQKERIKKIPGSRWDTNTYVWWLPKTWAACIQLRAVFGAELEIGPELRAWAVNEKATKIDPCLAWRIQEDADLSAFHKDFADLLYPFQRAGVAFMVTAGSALNADEMGLGKSVQAIASLEMLDAYPALVVCGNTMKHSWADEFEKWVPERRVVIISGTPAKRKKAIASIEAGEADVGIINYEALMSHTRLAGYGNHALSDREKEEKELNAIPLRGVIADEAHKVKDPTAKRTRALWYIGDRAAHRFALTGTPVAQSPEDAWCLMRFVSPDEYPFKSSFIDRYALESYNIFGYSQVAGLKAEMTDELFSILDPKFIRRLKAVALPWLPEKVYTTRYVRMETPSGSVTEQGKAYKTMREEMLAALDGGVLVASNPLTQAIRLCQFASACGEVNTDGALVLSDPSCKADALEEILLESGDKQVVVFAQSKQLINLCHARLVKAADNDKGPMYGWTHGLITGDVPDYQRAENVRQFQDGNLKVLLLTLAAGGEGLTLTAASTAIFLQRSWSAVENAQAEDRIHRIGQEASSVNIIDVVTEDTIEDRVREVLATKAGMLEEIARDEKTLRDWLAK